MSTKGRPGMIQSKTIIGLTGNIASGKSVISGYLKELGHTVIDADIVARRAVEKGTKAYKEIIDHFGEDILHNDGTLNRKKLGDIVFSNSKQLEALNGITHPEIEKLMMDEILGSDESYVFLDVPLLFKSSWYDLCDYIWLVHVSRETQLERLMKRGGFSEHEALSRIYAQEDTMKYRHMADEVFENEGTVDDLKKNIENVLRKMLTHMR